MSVQRIHLLMLGALIALAATAFALRETGKRKPSPRLSALASVPAGASFVATIDLEKLRQSELGALLLSTGRELPGVGRLDSICGFDPSDRVREVAVATPAKSSELGIVAVGELDAEQIARCAEAVVARRGGSPARTQIGGFIAVRDRGSESGEVAVRPGGPVLLGEGRYLRDMIDVTSGQAANVHDDAIHRALRRRLGADAALLATWSLDASWLERATGDELARLSPLAEIRAIGARIDVKPEISAQALLVCSTPPACAEVASVLRNLSRDIGPLMREQIGDNPLEGARIERLADGGVKVDVMLSPERASAIVRRAVLRFAAPEPEPLVPDEVIRPSDDAAKSHPFGYREARPAGDSGNPAPSGSPLHQTP